MTIHRRLLVLVGLGMLLTMAISVLSLQNIASVFSQMTKSVNDISLEVHKMSTLEQTIADAARMVHDYAQTGDDQYRRNYAVFHDTAARMLKEVGSLSLDEREKKMLATLKGDFQLLESKADLIFSQRLSDRGDRRVAASLVADLDNLLVWMKHDLDLYRDENAARLDAAVRGLHGMKVRISVLLGLVLFTVVGFLLAFGVYLNRKVSVPLGQLWAGTGEISRGNLEYQVRVRGETDIEKLADRFNDMAQKLKVSYADLEHRLLERTQQLGALNSVALMLGQSGLLREVLQRSLATIIESFDDIDPRGGIFLCEPDGETLRLMAHRGLSPEFVIQEDRIRMGECLCGLAAKTGEMIYSAEGCSDPRHTRLAQHRSPHIVVPIKSRGIVLGVMFLYPTKEFVLKPSDVQMFDTIGAQLGMAVENLRLYGEVKESSEKFWDLFENSRDILVTVDLEGRLTAANEAMERFTARSKPDLVGTSILSFLTDEGKTLMRRILAGEEPLHDRMYEFEVIRPGHGRAFLEVSGRGLYRKHRLSSFHLAARDITEQKNIRALLVQAERLSAMGQIIVTVRHEINNPLTTVIGNAELLIDRCRPVDIDLKKRLETILDNALRIAEIVKQLQEIKQDRTVDYVQGVKMTDLRKG